MIFYFNSTPSSRARVPPLNNTTVRRSKPPQQPYTTTTSTVATNPKHHHIRFFFSWGFTIPKVYFKKEKIKSILQTIEEDQVYFLQNCIFSWVIHHKYVLYSWRIHICYSMLIIIVYLFSQNAMFFVFELQTCSE